MKTFETIFVLILLPFCALAQKDAPGVNCAAGQVVWWGKDEFLRNNTYSTHTNGLIEDNNEFLTNVVAVAGHVWQGLALKSDGTVFCFGLYFGGGNNVPTGLSNVVSIIQAGNSDWAIKRDGTVARWGNSDQDDQNIVAGLSNITSIAWGGERNYLALKTDGTLLGFRFDAPDSDKTAGMVRAVRVHGQILTNVTAIASILASPLILKNDGTVFSLNTQGLDAPVIKYYSSNNSSTTAWRRKRANTLSIRFG